MIGIFDSGVGGLTVWKAIVSHLPNESLLYFGDTARVPYGSKSASVIIRYAEEVSDYLLQYNPKLLVVACHTASAYALSHLENRFSIPVIGVIQAGIEEALAKTLNYKIAILGTKATIQSNVYPQLIKQAAPQSEILSIACPLLVPLAEEGLSHHPATLLMLKDYLQPILSSGVDTVLLGCTHYPLLKSAIAKILGNPYSLVDASDACAKKIKTFLVENNLSEKKESPVSRFFVSDDAGLFQKSASHLLGLSLKDVTQVSF